MKQVPEGFTPFGRVSPFAEMVGPLYTKSEDSQRVIGLTAEHNPCPPGIGP